MRRIVAPFVFLLLVVGIAHSAYSTTFIGRRRPAGIFPDDWAPFMRGLWLMEQSTNADATDSSGHGWTLTHTGASTKDTTNFIEGTAATNVDASANQYFQCVDGTCGGTSGLDLTGNITVGCWWRPADHTQEHDIIGKQPGFTGYLVRETTGAVIECRIGETTNTTGVTTLTDNTFHHSVCLANGTAQYVFLDAAQDKSRSTSALPADNAGAFEISAAGAAVDANGRIDECFVDDIGWGTSSICRACAIGIGDGTGAFATARGMCDPLDTTGCAPGTNCNYLPCTQNSDCNSPYGLCVADTVAGDGNQDYCRSSKCCMGQVDACSDCELPPCDQSAPLPPAPVAMTDWSGIPDSVWRFEGGTPLVGEGTATNKTLTDHGSSAQDTTNFREGAASRVFSAGSNQYLDCADGTCTQVDGNGSTSMSWGCWFRYTAALSTTARAIQKLVSNNGYNLGVTSTGRITCQVANGATPITAQGGTGSSNTVAINAWVHLGCRANGTDIRVFRNGSQNGTTVVNSTRPGNSTMAITLNDSNSSNDWSGNDDECFVDVGTAYGPQTWCRLCSVGFTGAAGSCDGIDNTLFASCTQNADCGGSAICGASGKCDGYRESRCGGCSIGDCNKAAPDTN